MIADVIEGGIRLNLRNLRFLIRFIQMVLRRSIRLIFISYQLFDSILEKRQEIVTVHR